MELVKKNQHVNVTVIGHQAKLRAKKVLKGVKIASVILLSAYGQYLLENPNAIYNDQI